MIRDLFHRPFHAPPMPRHPFRLAKDAWETVWLDGFSRGVVFTSLGWIAALLVIVAFEVYHRRG